MTKKEQIMSVLVRLGYKPQYDDDGDIMLRYQLKQLFFLTDEEEEDQFVNIIFPQFYELEEGEETLHIAACNKLTRETKMAKIFIDQTNNITATCEFFYANEDALEMCVKKALRILGVVRSDYHKCIKELSE